MNFKRRRYRSTGKSVYQIAKEMGISQKKVQDVVNTESTITNEITLHNDVNTEVLQWYKDTDIKSLRASWGYMSGEVARKLNIPISTYSHIETKRLSEQSSYLPIVYDFFHDTTNINFVNGRIPYVNPNVGRAVKDINSEQLSMDLGVKKTKRAGKSRGIKTTKKEFKEMVRFFEDDLKGLLKKYNIDRKELAEKLGVDHTYFSWCIHHAHEFSKPTEKMQRVFNYFKDLESKEVSVGTTNYYQVVDSKDTPVVDDTLYTTTDSDIAESIVKEIHKSFSSPNALVREIDNNDSITKGVDNNDSVAVEPHPFKHFGEEENKAVRNIIKKHSEPIPHDYVGVWDPSLASLVADEYNPADLIDEKRTIEELLIASANNVFKAKSAEELDLELKKLEALKIIASTLKDLKGDK